MSISEYAISMLTAVDEFSTVRYTDIDIFFQRSVPDTKSRNRNMEYFCLIPWKF